MGLNTLPNPAVFAATSADQHNEALDFMGEL